MTNNITSRKFNFPLIGSFALGLVFLTLVSLFKIPQEFNSETHFSDYLLYSFFGVMIILNIISYKRPKSLLTKICRLTLFLLIILKIIEIFYLCPFKELEFVPENLVWFILIVLLIVARILIEYFVQEKDEETTTASKR
jgi:hypothetical protein